MFWSAVFYGLRVQLGDCLGVNEGYFGAVLGMNELLFQGLFWA